MLAVIHRRGAIGDAGALPVAGRPLIVRQLQWLRMAGATKVAVEVGTSDAAMEVARWIESEHALAATVVTVLTADVLDPLELARRAGFTVGERVLAVPADVLGSVDLAACPADGAVAVRGADDVPTRLGLDPGTIHFAGPAPSDALVVDPRGWLVRVTSVADAVRLAAAALSGALPALAEGLGSALVIHAARGEGDVWIGRGARVEEGARLIGPVLIGPGAAVRAGATVGPAVVLGDRAVVERGASLREVHVDDGVVVGEGLFVERAHVTAGALRPFDTGAIVAIDDPLLVAARDERRDRRLASRAAALLALPLALVLDAVVAMVWSVRLAFSDVPTPTAASALLLGVLTGRRAWIGTADGLSVVEWVERGPVLAIDDALVPEDADALARRLARAWYALSKAPGLDARLVARTLARRVSRSGERVDERAVDEGGERGAKVVTA